MSDSQTSRTSAVTTRFFSIIICLLISRGIFARAYDMEPRWGQASTFIPNPPTILVQGGKTDSSGAFTYTSAPNSGDTLLIPLDNAFTASSAPITLVNTTTSPQYAFHTLSTLGGTGSVWDVLSFGGDGGPSEPTQTQADSSWRGKLDVAKGTVEWTHEANGWGNQPMRRLYHSAAGPGDDGKVYITGGLKGDGSGAIFSDVYAYDVGSSMFEPMPDLPQGTYGHNSLLLPNGTLIIIGGVSNSARTGNAALIPLSNAYLLDTTAGSPTWEERTVGGTGPGARSGATLVLNEAGDRAFLFGGGDATYTSSWGDGWELDLGSSTWREVSAAGEGPSPRYGHSATNMGGGQVAILGGYDQGGAVDSELHIWDSNSGAWVPTFIPSTATPPPTSTDPLSSTASASLDPTHTESSTKVGASTSDNYAPDHTEKVPVPTSTVSSSASAEMVSGAHFPLPAKIGLILGVLAVAGIIAGSLLYRYRRRKRLDAALGAAAWNGRSPGGTRPYGSREKGGEGLMDEMNDRLPESSEKSPMIGLGMGAIGASLASISSKLAGRKTRDPYTMLSEPGQANGGPIRRSTRRSGDGIRLVGGPRPSSSTRYAPIRLGAALGKVRSPLDTLRESPRIDMLGDEDSRTYKQRQASEWAMDSVVDKDKWTSARSILGSQGEASDPFEDDSTDGEDEGEQASPPPIRGGPVPTPHASRSDLDPFDDYANRRSSTFLSAFDDILSPVVAAHSDSSLPRSQRSGLSGSISDMEEGSIRHAQFASQTSPQLLSPSESDYRPIRRTGTFLQRMAQGGITSLLTRQASQRGTVRVLDIRDPTPAPALWPINSRDELASPSTLARHSRPATAFQGGLEAPANSHTKGPSLSSIQSARSMRDMVIVQRERTASSGEEGVMEAYPTPDLGAYMDEREVDFDAAGDLGHGMRYLEQMDPNVYAHTRHGLTSASDSLPSVNSLTGGETPESVVFDGAAFAPTPRLKNTPRAAPFDRPMPADEPITTPTKVMPALLRPVPPRESPRPLSPGFASLATPGRGSEPPSGSPVPSPLLSHRRAVKDVVNSINKRGGGLPLAFASPSSVYSPGTPAPPSPLAKRDVGRRPMTMYEAVKRERLLVANPDGRRDLNRTNSS